MASRMDPKLGESILTDLQAIYDRHSAHLRRAMRYYDDAPDGSRQKGEAVKTMNALNDKIHAVEAAMSKVMDSMDEEA